MQSNAKQLHNNAPLQYPHNYIEVTPETLQTQTKTMQKNPNSII